MYRSSLPRLFAPTSPQPDKPLMVLLPGMDGTGKLFAPQITSLSRYFDLRCLALPEDNRQGWRSLAETVVTLIHPEQQARTTYLCGESFGGCLALQVALTAPELFDRLVLINPASSLRQQGWLRWVTQVAHGVPGWLFMTAGSFVLPMLANFERMGTPWQRAFIETVRPLSQECVVWRLSLLHNFELSPQLLRRLTVPTALLASGRDRLLPSRQEVEHLQQFLPHAVTYDLPDSGHVCLLETAIDLAQCLQDLDFLPVTSHTRG